MLLPDSGIWLHHLGLFWMWLTIGYRFRGGEATFQEEVGGIFSLSDSDAVG